jgi:hypothetical protein
MLEPDYFSGEYLKLWRAAVDYAASKGMRFWLYDEDGWPSGSAGQAVVKENPELVQKYLQKTEIVLKAGEAYIVKDGVLAAFKNKKRITDKYIAESDTVITEFSIGIAKGHVNYPDILNPETTRKFIRLTHEKTKEVMQENIGSTMKIAFTDEPSTGKIGFTDDLFKMFYERYGYDLCDYLPALFDPRDIDEDEIKARQDYYELVAELLANNYFMMLKNWCADNGMLSSGHLGGENDVLGCIKGSSGFYQPLRMLRCFDIPGVDAIWRQIFPKPAEYRNGKVEGENKFFPRYASSAANQNGSNTSVTESYAVYGAGLTYAQMRYVQNFQFVRGINLLNIMNMTYGHVDFLMGGLRPSFTPLMPGANDIAEFNLHSARLTYLLTAGRPCVETAVYMPFRDFWADKANSLRTADEFEKIGFAIERMQGNFDVIDDDLILAVSEDEIAHGILRSGYANYKTIYMPSCKYIPDEVKQRLAVFIKGGGVVYELKGGKQAIEGSILFKMDQISSLVKPVVRSSSDKIRAIKRLTDNGELYFIYNEGFESVKTEIAFPIGSTSELATGLINEMTSNSLNEYPGNTSKEYLNESSNATLSECPSESLSELQRKLSCESLSESLNKSEIYEFDTVTGEIRITENIVKCGEIVLSIELQSGEGHCYLLGKFDGKYDFNLQHEQIVTRILCEISDFTFRRLREFVIGEHNYISREINEEPQKVKLGKWPAPEDFSGDVLYTATFKFPETLSVPEAFATLANSKTPADPTTFASYITPESLTIPEICTVSKINMKRLKLDLGEVKYSCETFLNGKSLGIRCMPPYSYEFDATLLQKGSNLLEIRVSNTAANQFVHTKSFDKWNKVQMGPYHKLELTYEAESLNSGLYGSVRIMI